MGKRGKRGRGIRQGRARGKQARGGWLVVQSEVGQRPLGNMCSTKPYRHTHVQTPSPSPPTPRPPPPHLPGAAQDLVAVSVHALVCGRGGAAVRPLRVVGH